MSIRSLVTRSLVAFVSLFSLTLLAPAAFADNNPHVLLTTSVGDIELELDSQKAPVSAKNFVDYVNSGHYNNTIFHRIIPGFVIQGGGFTADMQFKKTNPPIKNEANNGLRNEQGTLAMARTSDKDSATTQFFVNLKNNSSLDNSYAVFGKVVKGMDVIDKIAEVATENVGPHQNVPKEPIIIRSAKVLP